MRTFTVTGVLVLHGGAEKRIAETYSASDLPKGRKARREVEERVRQRHADLEWHKYAAWKSVRVREQSPAGGWLGRLLPRTNER